jgi:hypothetical protein
MSMLIKLERVEGNDHVLLPSAIPGFTLKGTSREEENRKVTGLQPRFEAGISQIQLDIMLLCQPAH